MTQPNDEPVKETVDHPEHVGETETTPPPVDPPKAHDDSKELINGILARLDTVEETVKGLIPQERDTTPQGRPWTHKFGKR